MECEFPYVFRWNRCGRKGQLCKVCARVEFEDGFVIIPSRNAVSARRRSWIALPF